MVEPIGFLLPKNYEINKKSNIELVSIIEKYFEGRKTKRIKRIKRMLHLSVSYSGLK
ncbi:hypothetical protein B4082_2592 [Bacillus cereus]|uniref:Uncharacterized protein n=1 Tax=Bacillus cereus TaxID=1396 RepID=A0A161QIT5_BACCE|nr:hypothetical protein B4082_2592 [Bacillus cereus]